MMMMMMMMMICKRATNRLGGVHSLHYINPPKWSKPEAASTSTTAPAVSTACRSPRDAGDSPGSHLLGVQVVIDLPPLLTQDESCQEASSTAAHSRGRRLSPRLIILQGLRPDPHHGSMRPRRNGIGRVNVRQSASTPIPASGHLLRGEGKGTDCPKPTPKLGNVFPPAGVFWVAAGRSGTDGGVATRPPNVPRQLKRPEGPGHARQGHAARAAHNQGTRGRLGLCRIEARRPGVIC